MGRFFEYAIIKFSPQRERGEVLNLGVVVFGGDANDVRIGRNLWKLHSLIDGLALSHLQELPLLLNDAMAGESSTASKLAALQNFGPFGASDLGAFFANTKSEYEREVSELLTDFVHPQVARRPARRSSARLSNKLRGIFTAAGVMGCASADIDHHKVVKDFPIVDDEDLISDFAYRNGRYHFVQAIDLGVDVGTKTQTFRECCEKAIVFDQAAKRFGKECERYLVYSLRVPGPRSENEFRILRDYSTRLVDIDSKLEIAEFSAVFGGENLFAH